MKIEPMKWYDFRVDSVYSARGEIRFYLRSQRPSVQNPLIPQIWAYLAAPAGPSVSAAEYQPHRLPSAGIKEGTVVLREGTENALTR